MQVLLCAVCNCAPETCSSVLWKCKSCIKKTCCCVLVHSNKFNVWKKFYSFQEVFLNIKRTFIAALGIEILCILSAELGEHIGLSIFGFNLYGISIAYVLGFAIAGFSTFMTIFGRYDFDKNNGPIMSCCSFLEQNTKNGFLINLVTTFLNFTRGFTQIVTHRRDPQIKLILKTSLIILITAESACIITAETVTLLFYQYSIFLAIPLALLIGTLTLTLVESVRKIRNQSKVRGCLSELQSEFISSSDFRRLGKKSS